MKKLIGKVVSTKMKKTVVVLVARQVIHPLYKKIMRKTTRIKVHNEDLDIKEGDMIEIAPCRPISKEKHYKVVKKL